jgi:hypothetical protein
MAPAFLLFHTIPRRFICPDGTDAPIAMWLQVESIIIIVIRNIARNAAAS